MNRKEILENARLLVAENEVGDAIKLLENLFIGDPEFDDLILSLARFNLIKKKQRNNVVSEEVANIEHNKINSSVLQFIRGKEEYLQFKEKTFFESHGGDEAEISVFFSVGSPHNHDQQKFVDELKGFFKAKGINLKTLSDWNDDDPIIPILTEIKNSSGCLVLALERSYIEDGKEKRGSEQEISLKSTSLTSPWLHIEAAIARSIDLPLLIIKDERLRNEGLIHNDKQEWGVVRIKEKQFGDIRKYPLKNFMLNWINQVKNYHERQVR